MQLKPDWKDELKSEIVLTKYTFSLMLVQKCIQLWKQRHTHTTTNTQQVTFGCAQCCNWQLAVLLWPANLAFAPPQSRLARLTIFHQRAV
jgi:hypothetical protein